MKFEQNWLGSAASELSVWLLLVTFPLGSSFSCLCFFPFDVSDGRCGIIASIPDHYLPFYFSEDAV